MESIQFEVSAKTARLIGRENISGVDGAIIELVKNSYDADATCVCVIFNMPFPSVPAIISSSLANSLFSQLEKTVLFKYYDLDQKSSYLKKRTGIEDTNELVDLLQSKNTIVVSDNGHGMNKKTLTTAWMNIGTNDKEINRLSPKGRIKTGAKGIGRFALDKLSKQTRAITKSADDSLLRWSIDWQQFEQALLLNEVSAFLETSNTSYLNDAIEYIPNFSTQYASYTWETGTTIVLSPTREPWDTNLFSKVNNSLRSIYPSYNKKDDIFDVYVQNRYFPSYSYKNEELILSEKDYDYKIDAEFDGVKNLKIKLVRNEVNITKTSTKIGAGTTNEKTVPLDEFWKREAFQSDEYRRIQYEGTRELNIDLTNDSVDATALAQLGRFTFQLYFLKTTKNPLDIIKPVNSTKRKSILAKHSGVKLYRDGFKVRPYGDSGSLFDWLKLGERAMRSPASIGHTSGAWRVLPYQILGLVNITRTENPYLVDMANRESLAQNDCYDLFVNIITSAISRFEFDRQYFFREFSKWSEVKEQEISKSAEIIANKKKNRE